MLHAMNDFIIRVFGSVTEAEVVTAFADRKEREINAAEAARSRAAAALRLEGDIPFEDLAGIERSDKDSSALAYSDGVRAHKVFLPEGAELAEGAVAFLANIDPGKDLAKHYHSDAVKYLQPIDGHMEVRTFDAETGIWDSHHLGPWEVHYIPANTLHQVVEVSGDCATSFRAVMCRV